MVEGKARGVFRILNMDCAGCTRTMLKTLYKLDGVIDVSFNYITDKVYVVYDPERVTMDDVKKAVKKIGFKIIEF
jgi:Cu+-exporting ATPase